MQFGTLLLLALAAWAVLRYARARTHQARDDRLPAGVTALKQELRGTGHTASYHDACLLALRTFASEYRATFQHGRCTRTALLSLHALRDDALRHLYELRMRLPNDLEAEAELARHIEDTDVLLRAYLQDAQARCGEPLLHPGPIDDMHYRQHYRAATDTLA